LLANPGVGGLELDHSSIFKWRKNKKIIQKLKKM
jgi:hypothetical protein